MRFKIDENLPQTIVDLLNQAGHDAMSVWDQSLSGASDRSIADVCNSEQRVIVTLDLDFADVRTFPPPDHQGLIVLRLATQESDHVEAVFRTVLPVLEKESPAGRLWIVEATRIRVRE